MWGCDHDAYTSWLGGILPGAISHLLFWVLLLIALVYLLFRIVRFLKSEEGSEIRDRIDSLEILKARFARGELSEEQYTKMKNVLLQP